MITATRRIQFCAGHRLMNHEGKCSHLHGHNYVALFTAEAKGLDPVGRVMDFSALKERIGSWIETRWDHGFIYCKNDKAVDAAIRVFESMARGQGGFAAPGFDTQKRFEMDDNPTAENMASYLLNRVCPYVLGGTGVKVVKVQLWETENCYAEVTL